jgi:hypothetical protein
MSVASLNIYHHGKHHPHPVPKWIARLFFVIIPKLLFMNVKLPVHWNNRRESLLQFMVNFQLHPLKTNLYSLVTLSYIFIKKSHQKKTK